MPTLFRKIVRRTLIAKATVVALIVLVIGGSQLLLRQLPAHQAQVKAWVANELGLELQFARLDAGWSWRGPELEFWDASVKALGATAPFITARAANVGFNPLRLAYQLLTGREVSVDRLTFEGTDLTLVKSEAGYRLEGAPVNAAGRDQATLPDLPDIDVLVRDSRVLYLDPARSIAWAFQDVAGTMRRDGDVLKIQATATPPREFASHIDLTLQAVIVDDDVPGAGFTGDWRLSSDINDVDLAVAAQLLQPMALAPRSGRGDIGLHLEWRANELAGGNVDMKLVDVSMASAPGYTDPRFERIALHGDWERDGNAWHVALKDLNVTHATRAWPMEANLDAEITLSGESVARVGLKGNFLRLEDVTPFVAPLPEAPWRDAWLALVPRGDLRDFELSVGQNADAQPEYAVAGEFSGLSVLPYQHWPGITGLAGDVRADERSGRLELNTSGAALDWPAMLRSRVDADLRGIVVWRAGQDAVRVVSDDLVVANRDATLRTNLELTLPMDGTSPRLDLRTRVSSFDIAAAPRYFPVGIIPTSVVEWLDAALRGGRGESAEVAWVGPLLAFPFDGGEGEFRATVQLDQAKLAFVPDWPAAEDLHGTVEFVNASFAAHGSGRLLGNHTDEVRVAIPDLRNGELSIAADTTGKLDQVLEFLNRAPLISNYLGDRFKRLQALAGTGDVSFDLKLPLRNLKAYQLTAALKVKDGGLAFRGFGPHWTEIDGGLSLVGGQLHGEGIHGIFLDGPVTAAVQTVDTAGYHARIDFDGEVTVDAVVQAFNLPQGERLAGQTRWHGNLLIPAAAGAATAPGRITVESNLAGVALRYPEPFAKAPGEPTNLQLEMLFPERGMEMRGNMGSARRFALDFDNDPAIEGKFVFRRAALKFGGALPEFHADQGVTLDGSLPVLRVDEWMALSGGGHTSRSNWSGAFSGADLDVADFYVFGQKLGSSKVSARRRTDDWQFELDSNAIAGTIMVPMDLVKSPQVVAVMKRLYLNAGSGGSASQSKLDPRELPGMQLHADVFGFGQRQLGRLDAEILSDPLGLRLVSFESATDSFAAQGSGGWFVGADGVDGDTTRLAATVNSTNVGKMLEQLGFSTFVVAETGEITASVHWPGPPSGAWLDHMGGDLSLKTKKGSLIDVEPGGAGRMAGLLSFGALPRRLALDFRDVFKRGFVFDEITADFVIVDGNAYTDNLKLTGPVADVGMVGRTGLRDHDYRQQAIVTAEPSKMLPTVGALIAGPVGAAALLIFRAIFKKPLSGIGRASYCVTGTWAEPMVEKLSEEEMQKGAPCAELPPGGLGQRPGVAQR
ncbi:MAG: YhdP family protein [Gammaproteobacteria bacterium]